MFKILNRYLYDAMPSNPIAVKHDLQWHQTGTEGGYLISQSRHYYLACKVSCHK